MGHPRLLVFEALVFVPSEPGDHQPREAPAAHVSQRLVVDHVVGGTSPQKRQEVQPALRAGGGEPGKISVADVRAGAVHALVAGAGVIDRDPRRALEPALKHTGRLGQEVLLAGDEKTHDLALGDRHPEAAQMRDDPRYRHLARVILSEHEAPELGAEVADRPRGQSRHHRPTIRGDPAFTAVADHVRTQDQLLDHVGLVSLEPRAGGNGRLEHPLLVDHKPVDLATPAARLAFRARRLGGLLHAARFELRRPLEPFQPRNLFA